MNFAQRREDKRPEQKQTIRRFVLMQREYHRAMRIWTVPVLLRIVFILIDMRADFPSPHREKLGAQKKLIPLSTSRLHSREEKVSEISHFPPHARTKICTNFAKTYLDVVERPFTEEFHFLRGEFSHNSSIYFMRVVVKLFLGFSREQKQPKIFWDFRLLDFWRNRSKTQVLNFPHFFSGFWSVLWCSLREFVLLLWLALLPLLLL